jgi:hypothetical protein
LGVCECAIMRFVTVTVQRCMWVWVFPLCACMGKYMFLPKN